MGFKTSDFQDILLENLVALSLKRKGEDFYYLKSAKTNIDVDFYVPEEDVAIQIATSLNSPAVYEREVSNLIKLSKIQHDTKLFILTLSEENEIEIEDGRKIEVAPLSRILLSDAF